jgi:hypothetical protein
MRFPVTAHCLQATTAGQEVLWMMLSGRTPSERSARHDVLLGRGLWFLACVMQVQLRACKSRE